jgi:hypothetical protein
VVPLPGNRHPKPVTGTVIPISPIPHRQHRHRRFRVSNFAQTLSRCARYILIAMLLVHLAWFHDGKWIAFASARTGFTDEMVLHPYNGQATGEIGPTVLTFAG